MGIIYQLISPSGKSYVGQTRRAFEKRYKEHARYANYEDQQYKSFYRAIRKYGIEKFEIGMIDIVPDDQLDEWEIMYIDACDSLYPNGYNLTKGGGAGVNGKFPEIIYNDKVRKHISDVHRKFSHENYELPIYVRYVKEENKEGFRINIPNKKAYTFYSSELTLNQKYNLAMKKYQEVLNGTDDVHENRRKKSKISAKMNLPKYVSYCETIDSFDVRKPGFARKAFGGNNITTSEKLELAINYLNSLN